MPICHQWVLIDHTDLVPWHNCFNCIFWVNSLIKRQCSISACFLCQYNRSPRVLLCIFCEIVNIVMNNDPQIFFFIVLSDLFPIVDFLWCHIFIKTFFNDFLSTFQWNSSFQFTNPLKECYKIEIISFYQAVVFLISQRIILITTGSSVW